MRCSAALALALAAVVLLVLVALAALAARAAARYRAYLGGVWVGESDFLREARLGALSLFVAPPDAAGRARAYLVMADEAGGSLSDQGAELEAALPRAAALRQALAPADALDFPLRVACDEHAALPADLRAALSVSAGTLALHDGRRVHAFLTKDHEASAVALAAWGAAPAAN